MAGTEEVPRRAAGAGDPAWRSTPGVTRRPGRGVEVDRRALGVNPETLRNGVIQAEIDEGHRPGTTTEEAWTGRRDRGPRSPDRLLTCVQTWSNVCSP
jgi:hypothetical protein